MGIRAKTMALKQCRLALLACAVSMVFVTTADHKSDALIELGTGVSFTGVVSSRNFAGEGKALKGIDQALEPKTLWPKMDLPTIMTMATPEGRRNPQTERGFQE